MKRAVYLITTPPLSSTQGRDGVEAALAMAAFGVDVQIVLMGDGIYHALPLASSPGAIATKEAHPMLKSCPLYDIAAVHVCGHSAAERNIGNRLEAPFVIATPEQIRQMIANAHHCLRY